MRKKHVDSNNLMRFKPTSRNITYMVSDLIGSTCLASSIDNYELPSNSSSGSFRFPLSNTREKAISETDLAHNFKMPKHSGEPRTEKLPNAIFHPSTFLGNFHFLHQFFIFSGNFQFQGVCWRIHFSPLFPQIATSSHCEFAI